jgi:DNA invertase Pin-like site-specific DNA recombinase
MNKCVIYARTAVEDPVALKRQVRAMRKFAKENGFKVDQVFREYGSGLETNPALSHLLQEVKSGNVKVILAVDFTRVTRKLSDWLEIDRLLKEKEVELITT